MIHGLIKCAICGISLSKYGLNKHNKNFHADFFKGNNSVSTPTPSMKIITKRNSKRIELTLEKAKALDSDTLDKIKMLNASGMLKKDISKELKIEQRVISKAETLFNLNLINYRDIRLKGRLLSELSDFYKSEKCQIYYSGGWQEYI